ncbi:MAG: class I SAM-dependent methyltransferase, partial [Nocardioidaceae bacterium]
MEWVPEFYSQTGVWWGPAEAVVSDRDRRRVARLESIAGPGPHRILELGCGYGTTAAAATQAGHTVVGVEISDRAAFAERLSGEAGGESFTMVRDDFYQVRLEGRFDLVCYWNGFGVGADADQRRLLRRVAEKWLTLDGIALIDIANPFVWARWDGDEDSREARPEVGYKFSLRERTT